MHGGVRDLTRYSLFIFIYKVLYRACAPTQPKEAPDLHISRDRTSIAIATALEKTPRRAVLPCARKLVPRLPRRPDNLPRFPKNAAVSSIFLPPSTRGKR